jgi:hypothetical protein
LSCCIMWSSSQEYSPTFDFVISPIFVFHLCLKVLVFGGLPLSLYKPFSAFTQDLYMHILDFCILFSDLVPVIL